MRKKIKSAGAGSSVEKVRDYLSAKKSGILDEISVLTYVTKPRRPGDAIDPRIVTASDPKSHIAEQYRSIRTNIVSLFPETGLKSFLVTSALRGEGKTLTSANLALAFSQEMDKRVILVDADLRKPSVHRLLGIEKEPGLVDVLNGSVDLARFIEKPAAEGLYVIPSGTPPANPAELLGSVRMGEILEILKEAFDIVVFDVSPILAVTDAGVLGKSLDGSILVVRAGRTQAVDVERAYSLLLEANANPIGSILTGVVTYIPYYLYRYRYMYSSHYYGA
ncbi:MAG TPA: CpsD/CapB family tyrosine-protein kinase [bacterium]|nr:CpsD/CapB family tyrosine-protein kinase [bacterium]HPJ71528.1 CpsD/CapB family tyrosine-protein kinase [bacterium]